MLKKSKFKMLFVTVITLLWASSISAPSYAKGPDKGGGRGIGENAMSEKGEVQETTEGAMPPGLAKEGKVPHGLEKHGKTPSGWSKGKKKGWKKHGHLR